MTQTIKLEAVHYMPKVLTPGILYYSAEFDSAAHICACGCGSKIRTPIGPTEWSIKNTPEGPTLRPSVGNWQKPCKSHYLITNGKIQWASRWSNDQIIQGRSEEQARRKTYEENIYAQQDGLLAKIWNWLKKLFIK